MEINLLVAQFESLLNKAREAAVVPLAASEGQNNTYYLLLEQQWRLNEFEKVINELKSRGDKTVVTVDHIKIDVLLFISRFGI